MIRRFLLPATLPALLILAVGCEKPQTVSSGADQDAARALAMEDAAAQRSGVIGQPAPDFTLPDQDDKPVSLHDYKGQWVVLYFYPADDTPGCACQANDFTGLLANFRDMNAAILGVSPDTPESHRMFIEKYDLKLRLLSDTDHKVMPTYGAWVEGTAMGKPYQRVVRSTYIIGPQGDIRYAWPDVGAAPIGHADRVRQKLAELQAK